MTLLKPCLFALLLFTAAAAPLRADEASRRAKVEELFKVAHMDEMVPQMTQQMMGQVRQIMLQQVKKMNMPAAGQAKVDELQNRMLAILNEKMNWEKLRPLYIRVYSETFTEEELDGIISFYGTPAGQAFLKKMPLLTQNLMQTTQSIMAEVMADVPRLIDETMKDVKK